MTRRAKRWAAAALVAALAAASITVALASDGRQPQPLGLSGRWHLVFDDEFGGSSLDTSRWSATRDGSSGLAAGFNKTELECYDPHQVSVRNGTLYLRLIARSVTCNGKQQRYVSGVVTTAGKFSFTYGMIEARVWLPGRGSVADWPAVWTVGANWPTDGEIDVIEGLGGQTCWHFHNPAGIPGSCSNAPFGGSWHTVAADWENGSVTWYYDGHRIFRLTSGVTSAPMSIVLDLALSPGGPRKVPAELRVRYVRVWQH